MKILRSFAYSCQILLVSVSVHSNAFAKTCSPKIFQPENLKDISCMVRYHGLEKTSKFDPKSPHTFTNFYLAAGEKGQKGVLKALPTVDGFEDAVSIAEWKFTEKDFGLKFEVIPESNATNSCQSYGDVKLQILTGSNSQLLGETDIPISALASGFVGQLTIALPLKLIDEQVAKNSPNEPLLTHVKFQCN